MKKTLLVGLVVLLIIIGIGAYYLFAKAPVAGVSIQESPAGTSTPESATPGEATKSASTAPLPLTDGWKAAEPVILARMKEVPSTSLQIRNGNVYCGNTPASPAVDLASLQIREEGPQQGYIYLRDQAHVWVWTAEKCPLISNDPSHFSLVFNGNVPVFMRDSTHVWLTDETLLPNVDPASVAYVAHDDNGSGMLTDAFYAKDKNHVYHIINSGAVRGTQPDLTVHVLTDAEPVSFALLKTVDGGQSSYVADKDHAYYVDRLMPEVDRASFVVVQKYDSAVAFPYAVNGIDARDKNHTYLKGEIVQ